MLSEKLLITDLCNAEELYPIFEDVKSYYKKAHVINSHNSKVLLSYNTQICYVNNKGVFFTCGEDDLTTTTLRHIKEFLKQQGKQVGSKKELIKLYM